MGATYSIGRMRIERARLVAKLHRTEAGIVFSGALATLLYVFVMLSNAAYLNALALALSILFAVLAISLQEGRQELLLELQGMQRSACIHR